MSSVRSLNLSDKCFASFYNIFWVLGWSRWSTQIRVLNSNSSIACFKDSTHFSKFICILCHLFIWSLKQVIVNDCQWFPAFWVSFSHFKLCIWTDSENRRTVAKLFLRCLKTILKFLRELITQKSIHKCNYKEISLKQPKE